MSVIRHVDEDEIHIAEDNERNRNDNNPVKDTERRLKTRYILALLGFLGFANVYAMRVNLSVAIVAMVNSTNGRREMAPSLLPSLSFVAPIPLFYKTSDTVGSGSLTSNVSYNVHESYNAENNGEFSWDERTQGIVLGSFFYGYIATQIPGGRLAEVIGGRHVFGLGILLTGIFTLLSPPLARSSKECGIAPFVTLRVLEGLSEGVTFPSMMAMMAKWVPPLERSRFSAIVFAGAIFGTVISMPISGLLCDIDLPVFWWLLGPGGWPLAFYIFGALGVIWYFAWMTLISDSPAAHPSISSQERQFIEWSLGQHNQEHTEESNDQEASISHSSAMDSTSRIPWYHLLTSLPLWASLLTLCGQSWAFYTLLTELPTYMANILHFDIKQNSFLSALPYLSQWICSLLFCWVADWLCSTGYLSSTASMKIFNSIGVVLPSLGLIGIGYAGYNTSLILSLLVLLGAFCGATYAGVQINYLALSPRLAGTLYGITNGIANVCGFLAPYVTGSIIQGHETLTRWRYVFLISAGINLLGNCFYLAFASGEIQPWDDPDFETDRSHLLTSSPEVSTSEPQRINDDQAERSQ